MSLPAIAYSCIAPLVLGFATIGLYLFYFAYRYDFLYVSNTDIDTQGRIYIRALQHTTVGCYLSIVCLIGLFAIGTATDGLAIGPLVLMILFLVFVTVYHLSLNQALEPLINYLPRNLEAEEEAFLSQEQQLQATSAGVEPGTANRNGDKAAANNAEDGVDSAEKGLATAAHPVSQKKPNVIVRFFRPDQYDDYAAMRRLIPARLEAPSYPPEVERDAYFHPSVTSQLPLLWVPRDGAGVSRQEVRHTQRVIPITDEDSWLDEKNRIVWDIQKGRPPIFEERVDI
jgi:calcium permeable stress-gated cation channel